MNVKVEAEELISRIPIRRIAVLGLLLGWVLLSTVVPVPAPPGGNGGTGGPD